MRTSNRIAVTGANGFLERSVVARLAKDGHQVTTCTRAPHKAPGSVANVVGKSDLIDSAFATLPMSPTHELNKSLGWSPAEKMPESLAFLRDN